MQLESFSPANHRCVEIDQDRFDTRVVGSIAQGFQDIGLRFFAMP